VRACVRALVFAFVEVHGTRSNRITRITSGYARTILGKTRGCRECPALVVCVCVTGCFTSCLKWGFFFRGRGRHGVKRFIIQGETPCLGFDGGVPGNV
jgi:hypothetical protein